MATALPQYDRRVVPPGPAGAPQAPVDQTGQALQRLAGVAQDVYDTKTREDDSAWTANTMSAAHVAWSKRMQELQDAAPLGAPGFAGQVQVEFGKFTEEQLKAAPSGRSKQFLGERLGALGATLYGHAVGFEAKQGVDYRNDQWTQTRNNVGAIAQQDVTQGQTALAEQLAILQQSPHRAWAADQAVKLKSEASFAAVQGMIDRDPIAAERVLGKRMGVVKGDAPSPDTTADGAQVIEVTGKRPGTYFVDNLNPHQAQQLYDHATIKAAQLRAQAARGADDAERNAQTAYNQLTDFVTEGRDPTLEYQNTVRALTKGTTFEAAAEEQLQTAVKGAGFGAQSLPAMQASLQSWEGKPTDPDQAKALNHARTVLQAQQTAFKEDPWRAGSRFKPGMPEVPPVAINDASTLMQVAAQRVPLMSQFESVSGQAMPLLQPGEVPQAIRTLQSMPTGQRTAALGMIGDALKSDPRRIDALAEQLGHTNKPLALTLKMGTDKTVAGRMASELVQIGAQALADKTVKKDESALAGWRAEISTLVRGTLGDTKAEDDVIDAAYYIRAAQELDGSAAPGYKLSAGADRAVAMAVGAPLERAGVKTLLPRGMTEAEFDTRAAAQLAPMAGQKFYVRGQEVSAESVANRWSSYGLRMVRPGMYAPVSNNAPLTTDKAGSKPLILRVQ